MKHLLIKAMPAGSLAWSILFLASCFSPTLQARNRGTESVEWLTCSSQIVAIGTVKEIKTQKGPGDVFYEDCVFNISEMIKGPPDKEISFTYRHLGRSEGSWKKPRQELLVFLSVWQDHYTDEQARLLNDPYHETRMHKRLVPTYRGLDNPSLITLADISQDMDLFDKSLHRISDTQTLLTLCRHWAASPVKHAVREQSSTLGGMFLMVPAEEKHRLLFLQHAKSDHPTLRRTAAEELWKFPGDESAAALHSLLNDTTESIWSLGRGYVSRIEYRVRSAAVSSLKKLGKPVPDLPLQRLPTAEEKRKYRHDAWQQSFQGALAKQPWKVAALRDGEVHTKDSVDWTIQEVDLTQGEDKCTLRLVPDTFGTGFGGTMKYIGRENPSHSCSHLFYASPSIPPDLEKQLVSYFGLKAPH